MLAGPSDPPGRTLALLAALALSACTREAVVTPFRIQVTSGGISALPDSPAQGLITVIGTGLLLDPLALRVTPAAGAPVEVRFDGSTGAAFPTALGGAAVLALEVLYDHGALDAEGAPLPVRALRVSAEQQPLFLLGEGTFVNGEGLAALTIPMQPEAVNDDVPFFELLPAPTAFEPSRCGNQYYDVLRVRGLASTVVEVLERGERRQATYGPGPEPWTVLFVDGWHRTHVSCSGKARAWVQAAAWR